MIIVTGAIQARLDTLDELCRLSLEHVARSRAEPGCLEHGVAVDANDGRRLVFFERGADPRRLARALPRSGVARVRGLRPCCAPAAATARLGRPAAVAK